MNKELIWNVANNSLPTDGQFVIFRPIGTEDPQLYLIGTFSLSEGGSTILKDGLTTLVDPNKEWEWTSLI